MFARVFKQAWIDTIKVCTIVNAFAATGVYPIDKSKAISGKSAPAKIFCNDGKDTRTDGKKSAIGEASAAAKLALQALEESTG